MALDDLTGENGEQSVAGIQIIAPGLRGVAEPLGQPLELGTPGGQLFYRALGNSGLTPTRHIAVTHSTPPAGDVTITVPVSKAGTGVLLLVHDSTGAVSWHAPDGTIPASKVVRLPPGTPATPAAGAPDIANEPIRNDPSNAEAPVTMARSVSFTIPASRFAASHTHVGLLSRIAGLVEHFHFHPHLGGARKVLSVVEYPIEHLVGALGSDWFRQWENNKHPAVIRWFPPEGGLPVGEPLSPTNWHELAGGRALLFIHGIFSSCESAFNGIGDDAQTWPELRRRYGNRIIGFDHPTASVGPAENATWFLSQIPNVDLDLDIVCHSRGGLVARSLVAQAAGWGADRDRSLTVGRIVFAATPNGGSQITITDHWVALVNRISSMLTLPAKALPASAAAISEILAALLEVVKIVGVGVALDLPGLEDMSPGSEFLATLARTILPPQLVYYAAAADFEPGPILANLFNRLDDMARVVDSEIFVGIRNDLAVPTESVWNPAAIMTPQAREAISGFPIGDQARRLAIGPSSVYWHCSYFHDSAMRDALLRWLPG